jgi:RNA polymerase sigma-32 factor
MTLAIDAGDAALISYAFSQPVLTEQQEREAAERGDVDLLVRSHLKLVVRIARGFGGYKLNLMDLVQEGTTGLMTASRRFDPNNAAGARFGTYAQFWIRAAIAEFVLHNTSLVKRGTTAADKRLFFKGSKVEDGTPEEVAERFSCRVEDVVTARQRRGQDFSLNTPVGVGDEERQWQDTLEDADAPNPEDAVADEQEAALMQAQLRNALSILTERERDILLARFVSEPPVTLRDLAQRYSVSAERIRQIEVRAIEKVRASLECTHAAA